MGHLSDGKLAGDGRGINPVRVSPPDQATPQPFYPVAVDRLNLAKSEIANVLAASTFVQRQGPLSNAISRVQNARDQIGANITFRLGTANLMF
jgi:hypothetical protein